MGNYRNMATQKTWGGRFSGDTDDRVERFTESISFDQRLYREDITASQAHARMLAHVGLLTKDEAAAQSMLEGLQGLLGLAAMSQSESPQAAQILKKISITSEKSRVKMALALDRSEVEKMIQEAKASSKAAPVVKTAPTPGPAGPKSIRITGLEGGPVELPVK